VSSGKRTEDQKNRRSKALFVEKNEKNRKTSLLVL